MKKHVIILSLALLLTAAGCKKANPNYGQTVSNPSFTHKAMKQLSDILVHDIFSPPVASRNYVYPTIAAYEIARLSQEDSYNSFAGKLSDFTAIPTPEDGKNYDCAIASLEAFYATAKNFVFSEDSITKYHDEVLTAWSELGIPRDIYTNSIQYGQQVAAHIIAWSKKDNYAESRSFPKYSVDDEKYSWKPTPPGYFEGIEPHWRSIRPMVIEKADQFRPIDPTPFDTKKGSVFYQEMMEVYETVKNANKEQKEIANFWDCNPYKLNVVGHAMHATKKITPGGHWIGIAKIAGEKNKADYVKSWYAYASTSIALFDGFISCWDEKYRSRLIRPETVINEHIDENWVPVLQTPPFPEYTSGHSVISTAASEVLSAIYGENFAFDDDTEVEYGLPIRSFNSFREAAAEAAISRLYGGIHYRPAIDNGVNQGRNLGQYIIQQLEIKA